MNVFLFLLTCFMQVVVINAPTRRDAMRILESMKRQPTVTREHLAQLKTSNMCPGTSMQRATILNGNHSTAAMWIAAEQYVTDMADQLDGKPIHEVKPVTWDCLTTTSCTVYWGVSSAQGMSVRSALCVLCCDRIECE